MKLATHNLAFHTDDVFATALLLAIYPDAEVRRTRDFIEIESADIVYDVGGVYDPALKRYDHHQKTFAELYDNGIKLSSFGLLWRVYGLQYCDNNQELADVLCSKLVQPIDAEDNGQDVFDIKEDFDVAPVLLQDVVKVFNPPSGSTSQEFDDAFMAVVKFASQILHSSKTKQQSKLDLKEQVLAAYRNSQNKQLLIFEQPVPFSSYCDLMPEALYAVFKGGDGRWLLRGAPVSVGSFAVRKPLPEEWAGLSDEQLEQASGVEGAAFCHQNRWLAIAKTRQAAVSLANLALNSDGMQS